MESNEKIIVLVISTLASLMLITVKSFFISKHEFSKYKDEQNKEVRNLENNIHKQEKHIVELKSSVLHLTQAVLDIKNKKDSPNNRKK